MLSPASIGRSDGGVRRAPALAPALGVWLALSAPAGAATAGQQGSYVFDQGSPHAISHMLSVAAVRIFRSREDAVANAGMSGAGFVVDAQSGLVATARHVVDAQGGIVWLAISGRDTPVRARVLDPAGHRAGAGPDFGLLRIDPPQRGLQEVEIQLSPVETDDHWVTGFGASTLPVPQRGEAGGLDQACGFTVRATTLQGDSGSAVVSREGLVDGLAVQGAQSQGNRTLGLTNALPLACVRERLLAETPDDQTSTIIADLMKGEVYTIRSEFQPPRGPVWFTNLRVAKALEHWVAADWAKSQRSLGRDRSVDLVNLALGRRLGMDLVLRMARRGPGGSDGSGSLLQKVGDALNEEHRPRLAALAYRLAVDEYAARALDHRVATAMKASDGQAKAGGDGGSDYRAFLDLPVKNVAIAQLYKGAADSMTKLIGVEGGGDAAAAGDERSDWATSFAASSVFYAPPGTLKASSWAALGVAAQRSGKPAIAVPAFKAAIDAGAGYDWALRSFSDAKVQLGEGAAAKLDGDFFRDQAIQVRRLGEIKG